MDSINSKFSNLNKTYLTNILSREYDNVNVLNIESNTGSKAGDHNLSDVSKITVTFTSNNQEIIKSFIVKDVQMQDRRIMKLTRGNEKEKIFYKNVLPEIEKLKFEITCKCYAGNDEFLLLQDLSSDGYKVGDRQQMLNLDQCVIAVQALAKFHASTHHLYVNNKLPEIITKDNLFSAESDFMNDWIKRVDKIITNLNSIGICKYDEMLQKFKNNGWIRMLKCLSLNYFKCLIHGDFWITNLLFSSDEYGKINQAKMIDFQLIRLSICSYDLHFLISTSLGDLNSNNISKIYEAYLNELNTTLNDLTCKTIPKEEFYRMMNETEFIGVFTALTFLPVITSEKQLVFKPPPHLTEEEKKEYSAFDVVYKQKTYQSRLIKLLEFYTSRNVI